MSRLLRLLEPLIALAVFLAAAWLLRRELEHFSYHQIRQALLAIPRWRIGLAIALTAFWTPKYLASPGGLALPRILANLTALIGLAGRREEKPTPAEADASEEIQAPSYD